MVCPSKSKLHAPPSRVGAMNTESAHSQPQHLTYNSHQLRAPGWLTQESAVVVGCAPQPVWVTRSLAVPGIKRRPSARPWPVSLLSEPSETPNCSCDDGGRTCIQWRDCLSFVWFHCPVNSNEQSKGLYLLVCPCLSVRQSEQKH